jgi:folate-binding protein YgfZ
MIHQTWQSMLTDDAGSEGPGLAYLPELAVVRFEGAGTAAFLQGYLTCDTASLEPDVLAPTALCSLKGRVVLDGWCALDGDGERILLILHRSLAPRLAAFLEMYLKFSRTRLEDVSARTLVLGSLDLADADGGMRLDARRRLYLFDDVDDAGALWSKHPHITPEAWLAALTDDGFPLVTEPVSERFLPQMLDLARLGAVDFEKGCYLGQEVVARAQHRGEVKRRLARLTWQGPAPPPVGSDVQDADGRSVGVIVQSAAAAPGQGPALAVLSREIPHVLRVEGVALHVRS